MEMSNKVRYSVDKSAKTFEILFFTTEAEARACEGSGFARSAMNLELLDPNLHGVPNRLEFSLVANADLPVYHLEEEGEGPAYEPPTTPYTPDTASALSFNRRGTYLAIGWTDGKVGVFDLFTRSVACWLPSHAHLVSALSWSRNSRYLLTGSYDRRIRLWYLAGVAPVPCKEREAASFLLDSEVLSAQLHPRFNGQCAEALVLLASGQLHVVSLRKEEEGGCSIVSTLTPSPSDVACVSATYDHHGQRIFMGLQPQEGAAQQGLGSMVVIPTGQGGDGQGEGRDRVSNAALRGLALSRDGHWLAGLINNDRAIRVLDVRSFIHAGNEKGKGKSVRSRDFSDVIDRVQWRGVCFSGNEAEWVVAGSRRTYMFEVYMWSREDGVLLHRVEGPKVELLHLAWHPVRSLLVTSSQHVGHDSKGHGETVGPLQFWCTDANANWSAFAPDFQELEENVEYVEKEDEFDVQVEGKPSLEKSSSLLEDKEDETVDIFSVQKVAAFMSDDSEDERDPFYIVTTPARSKQPANTARSSNASTGSRKRPST